MDEEFDRRPVLLLDGCPKGYISVRILVLPSLKKFAENVLTMLDMEKLLMSKRTDMVSVGGRNIILAVSIT